MKCSDALCIPHFQARVSREADYTRLLFPCLVSSVVLSQATNKLTASFVTCNAISSRGLWGGGGVCVGLVCP